MSQYIRYPSVTGGGSSSSADAVASIGTFDIVTPNAFGAQVGSGSLWFFSANASFPGMVNNGAQTFSGVKTLNNSVIIPTLSINAPVKSDGSATLVSGSISLTQDVTGNLPISQTSGSVSLTTQVSGILPAANLPAGIQIGSVSLTSQVSGVLPLANGGTNTSSAFTQGAVVFQGPTGYAQDASNLFYDSSNIRLGVGVAAPLVPFQSNGSQTSYAGFDGNSVFSSGLFRSNATDVSGTVIRGVSCEVTAAFPSDPGAVKNLNAFTGAVYMPVGYAVNLAHLSFRGLNGTITNASNSNLLVAQGQSSAVLNTGTGTVTTAQGAACSVANNGGGTITNMTGASAGLSNSSASSTVTTLKCFDAANLVNTGTITTAYGFYCGTMTVGTQTSVYSFYASDTKALNYFGGRAGFNNTAPTTSLDVTGTATAISYRGSYSTIGSVTFTSSTGGAAYNLTLPGSQGSASSLLINNGNGGLYWGVVGGIPSAYTPTDTQGLGSITSSGLIYQRSNGMIIIQGNFINGVTTASEAHLSLPTGLTASSILPTANYSTCGYAIMVGVSASIPILIKGSQTVMRFGSANTIGIIPLNGNAFTTGSLSCIYATIPIDTFT